MKLLFDQNISHRIINLVQQEFPNAQQVRHLNLENYTDNQLWQFAKENDFSIVTFDSDFIDITTLKGTPPKIIWLRLGNTSTISIANKIISNKSQIYDFLLSADSAFMEIT
jgi:predicted nuclease of predicted toxin-antitoxin system